MFRIFVKTWKSFRTQHPWLRLKHWNCTTFSHHHPLRNSHIDSGLFGNRVWIYGHIFALTNLQLSQFTHIKLIIPDSSVFLLPKWQSFCMPYLFIWWPSIFKKRNRVPKLCEVMILLYFLFVSHLMEYSIPDTIEAALLRYRRMKECPEKSSRMIWKLEAVI